MSDDVVHHPRDHHPHRAGRRAAGRPAGPPAAVTPSETASRDPGRGARARRDRGRGRPRREGRQGAGQEGREGPAKKAAKKAPAKKSAGRRARARRRSSPPPPPSVEAAAAPAKRTRSRKAAPGGRPRSRLPAHPWPPRLPRPRPPAMLCSRRRARPPPARGAAVAAAHPRPEGRGPQGRGRRGGRGARRGRRPRGRAEADATTARATPRATTPGSAPPPSPRRPWPPASYRVGRRGRRGPAEEAEGDRRGRAEGDASGHRDAGRRGRRRGLEQRRRRRRRRRGGVGRRATTQDDPPNTVTRVREPRQRSATSEIHRGQGLDPARGQEAAPPRGPRGRPPPPADPHRGRVPGPPRGRRPRHGRAPARRPHPDRACSRTACSSSTTSAARPAASMIGNVYLGRVQNVLPSAWRPRSSTSAAAATPCSTPARSTGTPPACEGQPKRIEVALKSGDAVLVQVTKDPIGHKGARLTSQISLPGRYLVYVPDGSMTGISRKLPDTERTRLKRMLQARSSPRTPASSCAPPPRAPARRSWRATSSGSTAQWEDIRGQGRRRPAPPALLLRRARPRHPGRPRHLQRGLQQARRRPATTPGTPSRPTSTTSRPTSPTGSRSGPATDGRVRGATASTSSSPRRLDRKVWLPSGGSLVIDRTEAMTVVDVNTGKFTGQGGNLEETVTKQQPRGRRGDRAPAPAARHRRHHRHRLHRHGAREQPRPRAAPALECLGRDRTKHQVAEVTSLGLVQMTRKRVGQGLLEVFSEPCEACNGRGVHVHTSRSRARAAVGEPRAAGARQARAPTPSRRRGQEGPADRRAKAEVEPRVTTRPWPRPWRRSRRPRRRRGGEAADGPRARRGPQAARHRRPSRREPRLRRGRCGRGSPAERRGPRKPRARRPGSGPGRRRRCVGGAIVTRATVC